jgi:hypothetical protein
MNASNIDSTVNIKIGAWLWKFMPRTTGAFVLYNTIHVRRNIIPLATSTNWQFYAELMAHEYCHVLQYRKYPYTFLPRYFGGIVGSAIRDMWSKARSTAKWWNVPFEFLNQCARISRYFRTAYLAHPFEVEARAYQKEHYLEWVSVIIPPSQ